ncbi:MAG: hypothetical protein RIB59_13660 [Rhodospirillales bacterium]
MKVRNTRSITVAGIALLSTALAFMPAAVQADLDFSGKKITLIVPFKEGGGVDQYARFFQPFFEKHLPGKPAILVVNKPGGASVRAGNWFEREAKPDGLTVFMAGNSTMTNAAVGGKKVKFNMLKWRPIIATPSGTCFYAKKETGITGKNPAEDIKKLQSGKWVVATQKPVSASVRYFMALEMLGVKNLTYLYGLGSGPRRKAFQRNEVTVSIDTAAPCLQKVRQFEKRGQAVMFMALGYRKSDGTMGRDPAFPELYTVAEAYQATYGKPPSGQIWQALKHFINFTVMTSYGMFLPKGTNDDIVNTYVTAMKKILADPAFKKKSAKLIGNYPQVLGHEATVLLKDALDITPDTRKWLNNWFQKISK